MSEQEERFKRLSELARNVPAWSGVRQRYGVFVRADEHRTAVVFSGEDEDDDISPLLDACGDVEALERALRALAGEPTAAELEVKRLREGVAKLADKFDERAMRIGWPVWDADQALRHCAIELRELLESK